MTTALHGFPDWQKSLMTADLQALLTAVAVNPATVSSQGPFDMRAYSSFSVVVEAQSQGAPTGWNPFFLGMWWSDDAVQSHTVFEDTYHWHASANGGAAFQVFDGRIEFQDAVHGPFLKTVIGNAGADICDITGQVLGNSRTLPGPYVRNRPFPGVGFSDTRDTLLETRTGTAIGAGVTQTIPIRLAPGRARFRFAPTTTGQVIEFRTCLNEVIEDWFVGAGGDLHQDVILPKTACRINIINTGGVGGTYLLRVAHSPEVW